MQAIAMGKEGHTTIVAQAGHTAAAVGNAGVDVVSTTALILFLETAADLALQEYFAPGEASVGTLVNVRHLTLARVGETIGASATVTAVAGRTVTFAVTATSGERVLMKGVHERVVVDLARFLGTAAREK